jgi:hypothetical protein
MEAAVVPERAVPADSADLTGLLAADLEARLIARQAIRLDSPCRTAALRVRDDRRELDA